MGYIAKTYAVLIVKGKKVFSECPKIFKPEIKEWLVELDHPELIEEEEGTE